MTRSSKVITPLAAGNNEDCRIQTQAPAIVPSEHTDYGCVLVFRWFGWVENKFIVSMGNNKIIFCVIKSNLKKGHCEEVKQFASTLCFESVWGRSIYSTRQTAFTK